MIVVSVPHTGSTYTRDALRCERRHPFSAVRSTLEPRCRREFVVTTLRPVRDVIASWTRRGSDLSSLEDSILNWREWVWPNANKVVLLGGARLDEWL